jgi:hypothetical protein
MLRDWLGGPRLWCVLKLAIGSYPFFDLQHGPNTNVVLRVRDAPKLAQARREVEEMLERRQAQSN